MYSLHARSRKPFRRVIEKSYDKWMVKLKRTVFEDFSKTIVYCVEKRKRKERKKRREGEREREKEYKKKILRW